MNGDYRSAGEKRMDDYSKVVGRLARMSLSSYNHIPIVDGYDNYFRSAVQWFTIAEDVDLSDV